MSTAFAAPGLPRDCVTFGERDDGPDGYEDGSADASDHECQDGG